MLHIVSRQREVAHYFLHIDTCEIHGLYLTFAAGPTADAGPNQYIKVPLNDTSTEMDGVILNGTGSTAERKFDALTYHWAQIK